MENKSLDYYINLKYKIDISPIDDEGENYYSASIPELPGLEVFEDTIEEALTSLEDAKRSWIAVALKRNLPIPEPVLMKKEYSGRITLRTSKNLHRELVMNAERENVSLNSFLNETLQVGLTQKSTSEAVKSGLQVGLSVFKEMFQISASFISNTSFNDKGIKPLKIQGPIKKATKVIETENTYSINDVSANGVTMTVL
ncbi:type II toxin-antitoxin system HicB family antitoxin [Lacticaseibacillus pantheris]|nr:type II toxin-antitoxin system HicB family antitoxin [Lacticaseibacillus pantheris]